MIDKPAVLVCGKNKICADSLQKLSQGLTEHEITYVYAEKDRDSAKVAIDVAENMRIRTHCVRNAEDFSNLYFSLNPVLLISIQFSILVPRRVVEHGRDRLVNLHFSPLPRYRGMAPITLAILNGDAEFGVTLHIIDAGIDTGALVDQEIFKIEGRTNREVYTLCEQAGARLVESNMHLFRMVDKERGLASTAIPQNDGKATYFRKSDVDYGQTQIDFNRTAAQIERQARAYLFPPTLYPRLVVSGKTFRVNAPPIVGERCIDNKPGDILNLVPLIVASRDRALIFNDVEESA